MILLGKIFSYYIFHIFLPLKKIDRPTKRISAYYYSKWFVRWSKNNSELHDEGMNGSTGNSGTHNSKGYQRIMAELEKDF